MQVLDEQKRRTIQAVAAALFAERPFHEVRLEEIAAKAEVAKGTVYTYFKSKDDLYLAVLYESFSEFVDKLRRELDQKAHTPQESLEIIVRQMVFYACRHPHLFKLMRNQAQASGRPKWVRKREELGQLIEGVIRRGIDEHGWRDPHPEWTAQYIPGMVRSVALYGSARPNREQLTRHVLGVLEAGLTATEEG